MNSSVVEEVLSKKEEFLRRNLVLTTTLIKKLHEKKVIGELTMKFIKAKSADEDIQFMMLFDALRARGLPAMINFLHVLYETSNGWLADDIYGCKIKSANVDKEKDDGMTLKEFVRRNDADKEPHEPENEEMVIEGHNEREHPIRYMYSAYQRYPAMYTVPRAARVKHGESGNEEVITSPIYMYTHSHPRHHDRTRIHPVDWYAYQPLQYAAGQLSSLEQMYEKESSSTDQSMTLLKQEELAIRTLLQQNVQEQQHLVFKKEVLSDLETRIKEINIRASSLQSEPTEELSRARIRHLERIPYHYGHHHTDKQVFQPPK